MIRRARLGLRLLARDWRAGELHILIAALVIAVGAVTAVGFFNERVSRGMAQQSADMLGADLLVLGSQPADPAWVGEAVARGLRHAEGIEFASVAVRGEALQLASVRAVTDRYPVRGAVRTAERLYGEDAPTPGVPARGTVWVEPRLMHALALAIGDRIEIGEAQFVVARVVTYEPGRSGNFFALAPRVLMNRDDVDATRVIQPGSRVTYGNAFAGPEPVIAAYRAWIAPRLAAHFQLIDARDGNRTIARALERVERYIGLTSLLAVVLAGVAIAMAARRYSARHYDMSALLRSFGASQRDIVWLYAPQLLVLGLVGGLLGCALGWAGQWAIYGLMHDFFPVRLPAPGARAAIVGLITGFVTLAGFALPPVLRLKRVPPLRVLRRELVPLPASAWLVYGAAATAILALLWYYTGSARLTASVLLGGLAGAVALGAVALFLLYASRRLRGHVGVAWRFGFNNLWRRAQASVGQILAFGFALMAMALIALVRTDLLSSWQQQLPADTPNHFAFNILSDDVARIERFFADRSIRSQALYPMVRGRLTAIDGVAVTQAVTKEEGRNDEALRRELNLTWAAELPSDNKIVSGAWFTRQTPAGMVSVEEKLAKKLGIGEGARLTFSMGGATLEARVASIRSVQWDSFHPNFYMIFSPGTLDDYAATYLTSFHLTPAQKPQLTELVRSFPAVTVLELDLVLKQVRTILAQVTLAVEFVLVFVLAAGLAVLYAALQASLDERYYEGALMRALGASRRQLRSAQVAEFAALGLLAGLLAAGATEAIAYLVYARLFELEYHFKWLVWLIVPLAGMLLIGFAGYVGTRRVVSRSPLSVLREL